MNNFGGHFRYKIKKNTCSIVSNNCKLRCFPDNEIIPEIEIKKISEKVYKQEYMF